jgi:hypothetical protein
MFIYNKFKWFKVKMKEILTSYGDFKADYVCISITNINSFPKDLAREDWPKLIMLMSRNGTK